MTEEITPQAPQQPSLPVPSSWDTITSEAPTAPAVEVPESPAPAVASTAPAETPTLETASPLPAEPAPPRESESLEPEAPKETKSETKDEDVKEGDTPEILALPSGSSSRRWAREQYQLAKPIHTFLDLDKDIEAFGDDLHARSPSRYFEHVDDIIKRHHEDASKALFGMPYKDAKAKLAATNGQSAPTTVPPPQSIVLPTEAELDTLSNEQIAQRFAEVHQTAAEKAKAETRAEMEAVMTAKLAEVQKQLDAVTEKTTTHEQTVKQTRIAEESNKLGDKVWTTVVEGGIRDSGLEVKPDDPPEIASLKKAANKILRTYSEVEFKGYGDDDSKLTDAQKENRKLIKKVLDFAQREEFQNAWAQEDNLIVRGRAAFEAVKQSEEVQSIIKLIEAKATQSKATTRTGGPAVPVPGSAAGVTPKSPTTWDEAIQQAATSS